MDEWQLQEAKNKLSQVVHLAEAGRPQYITRHGKPVAVLASVADFERAMGKPGREFVEFLLAAPKLLEEEDMTLFERVRHVPPRALDLDI